MTLMLVGPACCFLASRRALEMTELLLAHGADLAIKDQDGLTAEQVARQRGLIEAAELKHTCR